MVIAPKESTRVKLVTEEQESLRSRTLKPTKAGNLRGQSGWLASNSFGRIGRLGLTVLKRLQSIILVIYPTSNRFDCCWNEWFL